MEIKFQKGSIWHVWQKGVGVILTYLSQFLVTREKNCWAHFSLTYIHVVCSPHWPILHFAKIANSSYLVSLWYDSWCWFELPAIFEPSVNSKMWVKSKLECAIFIYTYVKFIVIGKPRDLINGIWRFSLIYIKHKKQSFLAAAILFNYPFDIT